MNYLKIGFIRKTHGIKGELKVLPLTDNIKRFKKLKEIFVFINGDYKKEEIEKVSFANEFILLKLKNYNDIDSVIPFKGCYIYIDRKDAEPLQEWEFFTQDLIGCIVAYNGKNIGKVIDVFNVGANDNLVIKTLDNREVVYPFLRFFLEKVDIDNKTIVVNQYEGFFD
ncbi:MAG TPA: ribosome maturation factor RimM [Spirochaetota bacterium]|nr:ribosome maturation factor RimM [Spirochaetota bacterium]HPP04168.1 ribosome maturation factor RimM [Spirochaetota bacterium]